MTHVSPRDETYQRSHSDITHTGRHALINGNPTYTSMTSSSDFQIEVTGCTILYYEQEVSCLQLLYQLAPRGSHGFACRCTHQAQLCTYVWAPSHHATSTPASVDVVWETNLIKRVSFLDLATKCNTRWIARFPVEWWWLSVGSSVGQRSVVSCAIFYPVLQMILHILVEQVVQLFTLLVTYNDRD